MLYLTLKSLHIIGFVSWFAALFYLPRLFIYHTEAIEKKQDQPDASSVDILTNQFKIMEHRLYNIIMTPAMLITLICGSSMIRLNGIDWLQYNMWMIYKLGFILLLIGYHAWCKKIMNQLNNDTSPMSSTQLRYFNEIATLLLLIIVLLAVFKNGLSMVYALTAIVILVFLLMIGIKMYKKWRTS